MNNEGRSRSPQSKVLDFVMKHCKEREECSCCGDIFPIYELWCMEEILYCGTCLHMHEED